VQDSDVPGLDAGGAYGRRGGYGSAGTQWRRFSFAQFAVRDGFTIQTVSNC